MKKAPVAVALAVTLVVCLAAPSALAWHRHHHHGPRISIGFGFGVPFAAYPYYYYPPYHYPAYYPAPVVVQRQPTVYIEQQPAPAAQPSAPAGYWYYCADARAYYPYVKECPAGWQRVAPQP